MSQLDLTTEPDWETPLALTVTPAWLMHSLFASANVVHTGWSSCVDNANMLFELVAADDKTGNYCRLVEQEFVEGAQEENLWHDWVVEVRLGDIFVTGHWQVQVEVSPMDWDWCAKEAEQAFEKAGVLFGKRVRRGVVVEEPDFQVPPENARHH